MSSYVLNHGFPLFLNEFRNDERGTNEKNNRFLTCFLDGRLRMILTSPCGPFKEVTTSDKVLGIWRSSSVCSTRAGPGSGTHPFFNGFRPFSPPFEVPRPIIWL
ncbi:hypothetical protein MLD38_037876 [Melastoma candidum]|uniref:Uncharacterized protein n=1 Tax=Melastoma candidum TaxID=119954 RepID=A0ACB9KXR7_9MYRT|nr:hypothetical protein MLD38_037876 [Melastoma candidum]